jgi:FkbM family methyltransferase
MVPPYFWTIVAVEADPVRFVRLSENCKNWEKESNNKLIAVHAAVNDTHGEIVFHTTNSNVSGSVFERDISQFDGKVDYEWGEITVPATTVDSLLADYSNGVVKIDVEGSEFRVLSGAEETLAKGMFKFLVEIHPWGDPSIDKTPEDVFKYMADKEYFCKRLFHHHLFQKNRMTNIPCYRFLKNITPQSIKDLIKNRL